MNETDQTDFEAALTAALDRCLAAGVTVDFWWRDDDAVEPTPELDRLLHFATLHDAPLLLAVIPEPAIPALFSQLADIGQITISQHGFAHINHEVPPAKAAELGPARPVETVLTELSAGKTKLRHYAGEQFAPILTPPWNRISPDLAERRFEIGLAGLSAFGPANADRFQVNTQLDIIAWRAGRGFIGWGKAKTIVEEELAHRIAAPGEPFGLLTHHLVHDREVWVFLECFLRIARTHKAARWPEIRNLFSLS